VWWIVERRDGQPVAVVSHMKRLDGRVLPVTTFEVAGGVPWRTVWDTAARELRAIGEGLADRDGKSTLSSFGFWWLGRQHPLYQVLGFTGLRRPTAIYTRVPDLPKFLRAISPVLESRLDGSPMVSWTGELRLGFYRDGGVALAFRDGRLARAAPWRTSLATVGQEMGQPSPDRGRASALFPGLTFHQLLFGFRTLDELESAFPDCLVRTGEDRALLTALFPRQPSDVWPVL